MELLGPSYMVHLKRNAFSLLYDDDDDDDDQIRSQNE